MDEYFVRVYHMKDGTVVVPHAVYALEEQAVMALNEFNPNGNDGVLPEDDMGNVSYVTIEKRYAPAGSHWSADESQHHSIRRTQDLLAYLDRLIALNSSGHYASHEINRVMDAIERQVGLLQS